MGFAAFELQCPKCQFFYFNHEMFVRETYGWRKSDNGKFYFNCRCGYQLSAYQREVPWYKPELFMSTEAAEEYKKLNLSESIPSVPTVIMPILEKSGDETVDSVQLAKELKKAPTIAVEIIKAANARKNSSEPEINDLHHAITYIGRPVVNQYILMAAVKAFSFKTKKFDHGEFWKDSYFTGIITEALVTKLGHEELADQAFLAGCLANIGKIVLAICFPDEADYLYDLAKDPKLNEAQWITLENNIDPPNHCRLAEMGAAVWGLPKYIKNAAVLHHASIDKKTNDDFWYVTAAVIVANQLCHWVNLRPNRMDETLLYRTANLLDMKKESVESFAEEMTIRKKDMSRILQTFSVA